MPIPEQFEEIIAELERITLEGDASWRPGPGRDTFLLSAPSVGISVQKYLANGSPYSVSLYNRNGTLIDSFHLTSDYYMALPDGRVGKDPDYERIADLWSRARRIALDVEGVFGAALEAFRGIGSREPA
ncbi:MAG: hypothetical protein FJ035_04450 [Chloroflexi bacterium]|nr:hypothetical protein [Chloroflexota bacterium]